MSVHPLNARTARFLSDIDMKAVSNSLMPIADRIKALSTRINSRSMGYNHRSQLSSMLPEALALKAEADRLIKAIHKEMNNDR